MLQKSVALWLPQVNIGAFIGEGNGRKGIIVIVRYRSLLVRGWVRHLLGWILRQTDHGYSRQAQRSSLLELAPSGWASIRSTTDSD